MKKKSMALTNNIITIYGAQKTANTHYITITYVLDYCYTIK
jgi:hypothetical protein